MIKLRYGNGIFFPDKTDFNTNFEYINLQLICFIFRINTTCRLSKYCTKIIIHKWALNFEQHTFGKLSK